VANSSKTYEQGLVDQKKFSYGVVCYKEKRVNGSKDGFLFVDSCDVSVKARNEEEAVNQAKLLVKRDVYEVFRVVEA
jgi:hypothetical protein